MQTKIMVVIKFYLTVLIILCVRLTLCGRVKRVVGGTEVKCGEQLRIASLRNTTNSQHLCGATLLTPEFAITAAHCVHGDATDYVLHMNNYCSDPPIAPVLEIIKHELYDKYSRAHDIALLRVRHEMDVSWLNGNMLPNSSFGASGYCTIYGYGVKNISTGELSDKLMSATMEIISLDECITLLGYIAPQPDNGMMCALGDNVDSCEGDSGGPLICEDSLLEGLSSYGLGCSLKGVPGVYTGVRAHLNWIKDIIERNDDSLKKQLF